MAQSNTGEKTEEATPKRIRDARKKGQVFQSRDLTSALLFLTGFGVLAVTVSGVGLRMMGLMHGSFRHIAGGLEGPSTLVPLSDQAFRTFFVVVLPLFGALVIVAVAASFLQVGPLLTVEPMKAKLEKLDPIKGLKRLFSPKGLVELGKSILKIAGAALLAWWVLSDYIREIVRAGTVDPSRGVRVAGDALTATALRLTAFFVAVGVLDLFYQRWRYYKDLRMSKYDVKKEYKQEEGDPLLKGKRKEIHHEILSHSMAENVKGAKVVITNPTHIAVALSYGGGEDEAPTVSARGQGELAEKIIEVAKQHGVPVMRNVELARALVHCELDDEIPEELFEAVAAILVEVDRLGREAEG